MMAKIWVLLVMWGSGAPVIDLSPVVVSQPAFESEERCEEFRGRFIASTVAEGKKAVSRCQVVQINKKEQQPIICRPMTMTQEQLATALANPWVPDSTRSRLLDFIARRAEICRE